MKRLGFFLCFFIAIGGTGAAHASCVKSDAKTYVIQSEKMADGTLIATAERQSDWMLGVRAVRLSLYGSNCKRLWTKRYEDSQSMRLEQISLGGRRVVHMTTFGAGGSACRYQHTLFAPGGGTLHSLFDTEIDNLAGFHAGDLGPKRGAGIAVWEMLWEDEAHYAPHRYGFQTWRWTGKRFIEGSKQETKAKFEDLNKVPPVFGYRVRDDTRKLRFDILGTDQVGC